MEIDCFRLQVFAELKNLVDDVKSAALVSPTLIIIGKVVALSPFWPQQLTEPSETVQTCGIAHSN